MGLPGGFELNARIFGRPLILPWKETSEQKEIEVRKKNAYYKDDFMTVMRAG